MTTTLEPKEDDLKPRGGWKEAGMQMKEDRDEKQSEMGRKRKTGNWMEECTNSKG